MAWILSPLIDPNRFFDKAYASAHYSDRVVVKSQHSEIIVHKNSKKAQGCPKLK